MRKRKAKKHKKMFLLHQGKMKFNLYMKLKIGIRNKIAQRELHKQILLQKKLTSKILAHKNVKTAQEKYQSIADVMTSSGDLG